MRCSRSGSLVLACLASFAACTPASDTATTSAADPSAWTSAEGGPPGATAKSATETRAPHRWELADGLGALRKAAPRARSQHLSGEHEAEVLANEAAASYPALGPTRSLPPGALLVEALYRTGKPDVALYFAMTRKAEAQGGGWEYLVARADGWVEQRGELTLCERCHAEAPHDHVFGRAR